MRQEDIFSETEANAWFDRNRSSLLAKTREKDLTYQHLSQIIPQLNPKKILEIGCGNGYRLNWLAEDFNVTCVGLEPSTNAIQDGKERYQQTDKLTLLSTKVTSKFWLEEFNHLFKNNSLDVVIFGHCFYLMSPEIYFLITYQIDQVLREHGIIVIFDFDSYPQRRQYQPYKKEQMWSYKMDFSQLFTRNPMYKLIKKDFVNYEEGLSIGDVHNDCSLSVIRKISKQNAFIEIL